jgi:hypothetical protein
MAPVVSALRRRGAPVAWLNAPAVRAHFGGPVGRSRKRGPGHSAAGVLLRRDRWAPRCGSTAGKGATAAFVHQHPADRRGQHRVTYGMMGACSRCSAAGGLVTGVAGGFALTR